MLLLVLTNESCVSKAHTAQTLCSDNETILFSCPSGKKIISICATELSRNGGSLQYRFGSAGAPEIRLPRLPEEWRHSTVAGTLSFSRGGGAYLAFDNMPYRYVVYTAISGYWGTKEGVAIEKDGIRIKHFKCTEKPLSRLGPDLFKSDEFPEDNDGGFDLP